MVGELSVTLIFHHAVHFAAVGLVAQSGALVIFFFASAQSNAELGASVFVDEEAERHNGEAGRAGSVLQCSDFLAVEQELAVASRGVVVVRAEAVFGDVHVLHPDFAVVDVAIGIHEAGFSGADAFHLSAGEHYAGGVSVDHKIVELGSAVLDVDACGLYFFFCHECECLDDGGKILDVFVDVVRHGSLYFLLLFDEAVVQFVEFRELFEQCHELLV